MKPQNLENLYELSPLQSGILFHHLFQLHSGVYVEQLLFTFRGALKMEVFARAWQAVVDRHPALRTSFYWDNLEKPLQAVHRKVALPLETLDWRSLSVDEQKQCLANYLMQDRLRGFDPSIAPLIRLTVFQMADDTWKFLLRFSHLIMDGWSVGIILSDFVTLYKALWHGNSVSLPPNRPYCDYIAWLKKRDRVRTESFWREALRGIQAPTRLDLGALPPPLRDGGPTHERVELDFTDIADTIKSFAQRNQITLNTVIQGAWSLLQSRLTGHEDVITGSTLSGRTPELRGSETIVGVMIETLPVRAVVPPLAPVLDWLKEFQADQIKARQYNSASLVEIQSWSSIPRGLPLFESIVVFENVPIPQVCFKQEGLEIPEVIYDGRPHYPLSLMIFPGPDLPLRITYDRARYYAPMIQGTLEQLKTLVSSVVAAPDQPISQLQILPSSQKRVLELLNKPEAEQDGNVLEWVNEQTRLRSDSIAVSLDQQQVSYRELSARACGVAEALKIGREQHVAVFLERGPEQIAALLGIMACGGVYVPLDPTFPAARLSQIIEGSQAGVMITSRTLAGKLPPFSGRCLWIEDLHRCHQLLGGYGGVISNRQLAYTLYTSGSTGIPKGVQIEHRGLINHLLAKREALGLQPEDAVAQNAPCSFDVSIWQMLAPLIAGARVQVITEDEARDPEKLLHAIDVHRVTVLETVPAMLRAMVTSVLERPGLAPLLANLKWLICNAEPLTRSLSQTWLELYPHVKLLNAYGPTECSDDVTHYEVTPDKVAAGELFVPIGNPLRNTCVYVLDQCTEAAPLGVAGELYIGGVGVGRGYLNRPGLTAECYMPDPFTAVSGARLYRTGDKGRWRGDGVLEFLGRIDHQVKVRGFRIELEEIETVLRTHSGIREVVAVAQEEDDGEKRLVVYVVAVEGGKLSSEELQNYVKHRLPTFMVPAVVFLTTLPMTSSGKVDRRALPKATWRGGESEKRYVAPRTQAEEQLTGIWRKVLQLERVGVEDNFFELGGHSLLATQVISRVRTTFSVELPVRAIFDSPTVAALLKKIDEQEVGVI